MKDQVSSNSGEIVIESVEHIEQNLRKKQAQAIDLEDVTTSINDSDNDSGFLNASNNSLNTACEAKAKIDIESEELEISSWRLKIPPKNMEAMSDEEVANILQTLWIKMEKKPIEQRKKWVMDYLTEVFGHIPPQIIVEASTAFGLNGDTGISMDIRPAWLDMDKFRRGQKFAADNLFGLFYSELLSLFLVYSFDTGFKSILVTGNSSTPYACFKRYLSTASRCYNWYTHDVWTPGNPGYEDIRAVRKIHSLVRRKLDAMSTEELESKTKIENPWCPALDITRRDFQSTCPAPTLSQCYSMTITKYPKLKQKPLNQGEMAGTQFAFFGLAILSPKSFGLNGTDEDLEALCHLWRGLGYLLGIDDDFNFCRGTLEEIKARSRDFIEIYAKPALRDVKPEWEHVMRCMIEGLEYYFPGMTYETCLCDLAEVLNLHIPRLYNTMSYTLWIKHSVIRLLMKHGSKLPMLRKLLNICLIQSIERARNFDEKKHSELQERSEKKMNAVLVDRQKCTSPMKECQQ